jgi:hypothetical protein
MPKDFILNFERSGGFTGIPVKCTVDSTTLTKEEFGKISQLIDSADFRAIEQKDKNAVEHPDRFVYKLSLNSGGKVSVFNFDEQAVSGNLRPLLNVLIVKARSQK